MYLWCYHDSNGVTVIVMVFVFQMTFFVALLVLNERRVRDNKCDIFFWIEIKQDAENCSRKDTNATNKTIKMVETTANDSLKTVEGITCQKKDCSDIENGNIEKNISSSGEEQVQEEQEEEHKHLMERIMGWYADKLLQRHMKMIILALFAVVFSGCFYSITLFKHS